MVGETAGVSPRHHLLSGGVRDEESAEWTGTGVRLAVLGPANCCLDVQDHRSNYPGGRKDGVRSDRLLFCRVTLRQRVRLGVPGFWTERDGEIEPSKELGPPSQTGV